VHVRNVTYRYAVKVAKGSVGCTTARRVRTQPCEKANGRSTGTSRP